MSFIPQIQLFKDKLKGFLPIVSNLIKPKNEGLNFVQPNSQLSNVMTSASALGQEVKTKIGEPLAATLGTPKSRAENISRAAKILNLPETIMGGLATKTKPKPGENIFQYLNRVPYYGDVIADRLQQKGTINNPAALRAISLAIGLAIPNIPLGEKAKGISKFIGETPPIGKIAGEIPTGKALPVFQGFKDLTTNVLNRLKGKSVTSKQEILDFTNMPGMKQAERDVIRNVLDSYPKNDLVFQGGKVGTKSNFWVDDINVAKGYATGESSLGMGKITEGEIRVAHWSDISKQWTGGLSKEEFFAKNNNLSMRSKANPPIIKTFKPNEKIDINAIVSDKIPVQEFANKVKSELLPLTSVTSKGGGIGIAPYKTKNFLSKYENISLPDELRGNVANYSERIYNSPIKTSAGDIHFSSVNPVNRTGYFGHTRIEDMAGEKFSKLKFQELRDGKKFILATKPKGWENKIKEFDDLISKAEKQSGGTRRVIELQSDLYQKGGLEKEFGLRNNMTRQDYEKWMTPNEIKRYRKAYEPIYEDNTGLSMAQKAEKFGKNIDEFESKAFQKLVDSRKSELSKLQRYNDPTAHFRMVREEVKQAAIDGKTKLQFPTGETAMKIEGLGGDSNNIWKSVRGEEVTQRGLKVGNEVYQGQDRMMRGIAPGSSSWIITDVLGDGKFKAVQRSSGNVDLIKDLKSGKISEINKNYLLNQQSETFDISGKIDTSNPIYRFYEKDLGKYLTNKYQAKTVIDNKGVSWFEVPVSKEMGKLPVSAYGGTQVETILKGLGLGAILTGIPIATTIMSRITEDKNQREIYDAVVKSIDKDDIVPAIQAIEQLIKDKDKQNELWNLLEKHNEALQNNQTEYNTNKIESVPFINKLEKPLFIDNK